MNHINGIRTRRTVGSGRRRCRRGLSLVEVALAIVLVTILSLTVFSGVAASQRMLYDGVRNKVARDVALAVVEEIERLGVSLPLADPYSTPVIDGDTYTVHVTATLEGEDDQEYYVVNVVVDRPDGKTYELDTIVGNDK